MNEIYSISIDDIDDENGESVNVIKTVAQHIFNENKKNKIPLIITGSGISSNIPGMPDIMNKICDLLNEHRKKDKFSSTLDEIQNNYEKNKESENRFLFQSTLLTYIQCAYLSEQNDYVEHNDIEPLKLIWNQFVRWLLEGDDSEKEGLLAALPTNTHKEIVEMYKSMNAVSITTNFDNLLSKAFNNKEDKFFPLLTNEDFEKYYLNIPSELSSENLQMVEIQSRGDVFWTRCSGKNSAICPSTKTRCYIPEEKVDFNEDNSIKCSICKSPTDVYFAFPGTKEKDYEMSKVFDMVWKYIALRCSTIIIVGSSMNYDPVLLNFILELAKRKEIAILYISARNTDREITNKLLYDTPKNRWWLYGKDSSEKVLARLNKTYSEFEKSADNYKKENEYNYKAYIKYASGSIGVKSVDDFVDIAKESGNTIFVDEILTNLKKYSQLGLKTFWISSDKNIVAMHNRYKHSICTMLIASAIYLAAKKSKATNNELHFLQVAALLHDVGHLPFSHLIEEIFTEFGWIPYGEENLLITNIIQKIKLKIILTQKNIQAKKKSPK